MFFESACFEQSSEFAVLWTGAFVLVVFVVVATCALVALLLVVNPGAV
jgi:hypothetical protein